MWHSISATLNLIKLMDDLNIDIALIQETYATKNILNKRNAFATWVWLHMCRPLRIGLLCICADVCEYIVPLLDESKSALAHPSAHDHQCCADDDRWSCADGCSYSLYIFIDIIASFVTLTWIKINKLIILQIIIYKNVICFTKSSCTFLITRFNVCPAKPF